MCWELIEVNAEFGQLRSITLAVALIVHIQLQKNLPSEQRINEKAWVKILYCLHTFYIIFIFLSMYWCVTLDFSSPDDLIRLSTELDDMTNSMCKSHMVVKWYVSKTTINRYRQSALGNQWNVHHAFAYSIVDLYIFFLMGETLYSSTMHVPYVCAISAITRFLDMLIELIYAYAFPQHYSSSKLCCLLSSSVFEWLVHWTEISYYLLSYTRMKLIF